MLVENQKVEVRWNNNTRQYYSDKGYKYTNTGDLFVISAEDLPVTSKVRVNVVCDGDNCGKIYNIPYFNYTKSLKKYKKYLCKECSNKLAQYYSVEKNKEKYYNEFIDWCDKNNYIPLTLKEEHISSKSILRFKCPIHGKSSTIYNRIHSGQKTGKCCSDVLRAKKQSLDGNTVKNIIESKNGNVLLNPQDYVNASTSNLRIICGSCGNEFITSLSSIKVSNGCCRECGKDSKNWKTSEKILNDRWEKYYDKCIKHGYIPIMNKDEFSSNNITDLKIRFICEKHGTVEQRYNNFIRDAICKYCGIDNRSDMVRLTREEVVKIIEEKNNNILLNPEEYENNNKYNLKVVCGNCGNIFKTAISNFKNNVDGKCPHCNEKSRGEQIISLLLDKYNVHYIREYKFDDCKDKKRLPFDFYLPNYNMCIEFDGQGHYRQLWSEESFIRTVLHDGMKNNYCRWNNIKLLRIPYWNGDNIENILIKELNLKPINKDTKIKYISNRKIA